VKTKHRVTGYKEGTPPDDGLISHGACPGCYKIQMEKLREEIKENGKQKVQSQGFNTG